LQAEDLLTVSFPTGLPVCPFCIRVVTQPRRAGRLPGATALHSKNGASPAVAFLSALCLALKRLCRSARAKDRERVYYSMGVRGRCRICVSLPSKTGDLIVGCLSPPPALHALAHQFQRVHNWQRKRKGGGGDQAPRPERAPPRCAPGARGFLASAGARANAAGRRAAPVGSPGGPAPAAGVASPFEFLSSKPPGGAAGRAQPGRRPGRRRSFCGDAGAVEGPNLSP
jgi:hypothetical protein